MAILFWEPSQPIFPAGSSRPRRAALIEKSSVERQGVEAPPLFRGSVRTNHAGLRPVRPTGHFSAFCHVRHAMQRQSTKVNVVVVVAVVCVWREGYNLR